MSFTYLLTVTYKSFTDKLLTYYNRKSTGNTNNGLFPYSSRALMLYGSLAWLAGTLKWDRAIIFGYVTPVLFIMTRSDLLEKALYLIILIY